MKTYTFAILSALLIAQVITVDSKPETNCAAAFSQAKALLKEKFEEQKVAGIFNLPLMEQIPEIKKLASELFHSDELKVVGFQLFATCVGLTQEEMNEVLRRMKPVVVVPEMVQEKPVVPEQQKNLKAWYSTIPKFFKGVFKSSAKGVEKAGKKAKKLVD